MYRYICDVWDDQNHPGSHGGKKKKNPLPNVYPKIFVPLLLGYFFFSPFFFFFSWVEEIIYIVNSTATSVWHSSLPEDIWRRHNFVLSLFFFPFLFFFYIYKCNASILIMWIFLTYIFNTGTRQCPLHCWRWCYSRCTGGSSFIYKINRKTVIVTKRYLQQ